MWTNHIAFGASDHADLMARKDRLLAAGHDVMEIDHNWCHSVYATDPNGIMVEFCLHHSELHPGRPGLRAQGVDQ